MQLLFLGAPGAGKGTQCKMLSEKLSLKHLSSGDLLREAVKQGTEAGIKAKSFMDKGNLVPDEVLIAMFEEVLSGASVASGSLGSSGAKPLAKTGFILDGFPRNPAQAKALDDLLERLDTRLEKVINLKTSDELLEERITGRRVCPNKECNAVFHVKFQPPKKEGICDQCGTDLNHRSDDKPDVVKQRLSVYREQTAPLIEYYDGKGLLVTVDGQGAPEEVFNRLLEVLKVACQK